MKKQSALLTLAMILVLLSSMVFQVAPAQALAGTYFTTTDNENNAHTGTADGDMDVEAWNNDVFEPIEFNISVPVGGLPATDSFLTIRAYDVDEEDGQKDQVFLNGTSLGFLSGTNGTWSTTAFAIPAGLLVEGNNLVNIEVDTLNPGSPSWYVIVDWGQIVVDGGIGTPGRINSITVTGFTEVGGTITLNVDVVVEALADGTFDLETNLYDPAGNSPDADLQAGFAMTAGQIVTKSVQFVFPAGAVGDVYTIRGFLFDAATGLLNSIKSTTWTYTVVPTVYDLDVAGTYNYFTNDPAMDIATGLTAISTPAGGTIDGAIVVIGAGFQSGDTLAATDSGGVTSSYNSANGVLTLLGTADVSVYQTVLGTVKFSTSSTNTSARTISYSLGAALPYNSTGHFFEFVPFGTPTWTDSNAAASARTYFGRTGYLATINDAGENDFAATKIGGAGAWVGGSDAATEGTWQWVTGPEAGTTFCISVGVGAGNCVTQPGWYTNWNNIEPNDAGGVEDYMQFLSGGTGKWNDLDGATNATVTGYVVEYGGLGSDTPMDIDGFVTVNVTSNTAPVAVNDSYSTPANTALAGSTVLVNDSDADTDPITAVLDAGPSNASAFTLNADGSFAYTPNTGFVGQDTFTYHAFDGVAGSNVATVTIDVTNTAPTVTGGLTQNFSVDEDILFSQTLAATDPEGDPLTWAGGAVLPTYGVVTIDAAGNLTYKGKPNYYGPDTFTVTVTDGIAAPIVVTINMTVNPIDDPLLQENSTFLFYNNWSRKLDAAALNGVYIRSMGAQTAIPVPTGATTFTYIGYRGPDQGIAEIKAGTTVLKSFSLYNATPEWNFKVKITLPAGTKQIFLNPTGTKSAASTGVEVRFDGYQFDTAAIKEADLDLVGWLQGFNAGATDGSYRMGTKTTNKVVLTYIGQAPVLYTYMGSDQGIIDIYVDGVLVRDDFDLYKAGAPVWKKTIALGIYPYASHTIEIRIVGKNAASTGSMFYLDAIDKE